MEGNWGKQRKDSIQAKQNGKAKKSKEVSKQVAKQFATD